MNKKNYLSLIFVLLIGAVATLGTFAWLSYRTNDTAMVLTVGDINTMHITVEGYQTNETFTSLSPTLYYDDGIEIKATMQNNSINTSTGRLYYQINKIDEPLRNSDFKYTIERSIDGGSSYAYLTEGNFSSATVGEELTILEDDVPAGETYKYRVYLWIDGSSSQNLTEGSTFNGELRAEILTHYLYDVLKAAAADGTYARTYTGSHQDSMDPYKSDKTIYYWYGSNDQTGASIQEMNNVIFGNHCWQMIRTTDTGGVRLIYNGEPENNKCLDTRGTHVGYNGRTSVSLSSGSYFYGTDYTYDSANNVFSVSGSIEQVKWDATTGPTLIGKYTCRETAANATCASIYLVESYYNTSQGYVIKLISSASYSQFGTLAFNYNSSPAYVGYMYNTVYSVTLKQITYRIGELSRAINANHYYAESIDYGNSVANKYTLISPQQMSTLSDNNDLVGKYVLLSGASSSDTHAHYIVGVNGSTYYYHQLENGNLETSLMIGNGYELDNNIYVLTSATQVTFIEWYNSSDATRDTYKNKYACIGTSASCSDIMHITANRPSNAYFHNFSSEKNAYKYSSSVSYANNTYTLTGDIQTIWDIPDNTERNKIMTHHYTCFSSATTCATVSYINYYSDPNLYYMQLSNTNNIETAITNMLTSSSVNQIDSTIKKGVDAWYQKYLYSNYDSYIDDTIYCNDRTNTSIGAFNPSGGSITSASAYLQFKHYTTNGDLSCSNITDKFSVSNTSASLTYKVALISSPEMYLLNNNNARKTGQYFWLGSPSDFSSDANGRFVHSSGDVDTMIVSYNRSGVRPAVSLISGIGYTEGNGSKDSPYIADAPPVLTP